MSEFYSENKRHIFKKKNTNFLYINMGLYFFHYLSHCIFICCIKHEYIFLFKWKFVYSPRCILTWFSSPIQSYWIFSIQNPLRFTNCEFLNNIHHISFNNWKYTTSCTHQHQSTSHSFNLFLFSFDSVTVCVCVLNCTFYDIHKIIIANVFTSSLYFEINIHLRKYIFYIYTNTLVNDFFFKWTLNK